MNRDEELREAASSPNCPAARLLEAAARYPRLVACNPATMLHAAAEPSGALVATLEQRWADAMQHRLLVRDSYQLVRGKGLDILRLRAEAMGVRALAEAWRGRGAGKGGEEARRWARDPRWVHLLGWMRWQPRRLRAMWRTEMRLSAVNGKGDPMPVAWESLPADPAVQAVVLIALERWASGERLWFRSHPIGPAWWLPWALPLGQSLGLVRPEDG